jgi:hypothetical protein
MPTLLVHLIFHPASDNARQLARTIHKALNADPVVPGLRVPTVFCPTDGVSPPASYDLDNAECSFVVVLADQYVVDRDSGQERKWSTFIGDFWERCQDSAHRFLPVQLHKAAWGFDERLKGTSFLRAFAEPDKAVRDALIVRRLVIELCKQLQGSKEGVNNESKAPVKLFLSHTKLDIDVEPRVKNALTSYLTHDQPVHAWVDSGDIDTGSAFAEAIEQGIEESSLLCILTDNYASREWCRKEVILAKMNQRPMVVVEALNRQEIRSFPYLGNVPVLSWPSIPPGKSEQERVAINRAAAAAAVDLLLKETLRHLHATVALKQAAQEGDSITARPPELLTLLKAKGSKAILYPDPPLGNEELALLNDPDLPATTPLSRFAVERSLKGRQIALSLSESTDIQRFGFDEIHLKEAITEISRYLLIKGATLVYGGHLGDKGYTQVLFDLVRAHHDIEGMKPMERIVNTVGWPLPYNQDLIAEYSPVARLKRIERPADLNACPASEIADKVEAEPFPADQSAEYRYCWARGMTNMRESQVEKDSGIAARIILGGKFGPPEEGFGSDEKWYAGRIPGVLEEVILSAQAGQPVLLIGAFGGVATLAIDLLEGKERAEASWEYQRRAPFAEEMRDLYRRCGQPWLDYPQMMASLREIGVAGINPLLSEDENLELFHTRDTSRMIELILMALN